MAGGCTHIRHLFWSSPPPVIGLHNHRFPIPMPLLRENVPLASYTTMRIGGEARYFFSVQTDDEVCEAIHFAHTNNLPFFILGGGSNIVFSDEGFAGVVIKIEILGIIFEEKKSM